MRLRMSNLFKWLRPLPKTPEEKSALRKDRLFLIFAGILTGVSFAPSPIPVTLFAAFIPYFIVLDRRRTLAELNRATYLMGLVVTILTLYWVGGWSVGKDSFLMIGGGVLLFYLPLFFLIPSTLFYLLKKHVSSRFAFLLFPLFWVSQEFLLNFTDLHFPWLVLGTAVSTLLSFIQIADTIGAFGLSALILYINLAWFLMLKADQGKRKRYASVGIMLLVIPILYGALKRESEVQPERSITVGLVQPNLDPYEKWGNGGLEALMDNYFTLADSAVSRGASLVVFPETALPVYLLSGFYEEYAERFFSFTNKHDAVLLSGMPDIVYYPDSSMAPGDAKYNKAREQYYRNFNAVMMFAPGTREVQRYGKVKLVPFGERAPFVDLIPVFKDFLQWEVGISGWNPGDGARLFSAKFKGNQVLNIAGVVCFESVFPLFINEFVRKGAEILIVVTNDSWYGNTSGPYQHKEIAVLRAVECGKPVVRAANGGISCIISATGETLKSTGFDERAMLVGEVPLQGSSTFYSRFPLLVPIMSLFAVAITVVAVIISILRKRKKSGNE